MDEVGIVTLYKDNFGSILQCFSTYTYVKALGFECEIIKRSQGEAFRKIGKIPIYVLKILFQKDYLKKKVIEKKQFKFDSALLSKKTKCKMEQFIADTFNFISYSDICKSPCGNKIYKVIVGSDQIWNISCGVDGFNFLEFIDEKKRIALAPSFGTNHIPTELKKTLQKKLCGFSRLSAREESGVDIIASLTGRPATRLPDPTILLSKEQWRDFAKKGIQKRNYVLVHFLNKPNDIAFEVINRYLVEHNVDCICIVNNYESYSKLTRHEFLDIGPYDYVSLINNADFVFTDSFHSTLFSLNLETNFLTFDRQYSHANSQKTRVVELLDRCHELDHFIESEEQGICELENVRNWTSEALFEDERANIQSYLKEELER